MKNAITINGIPKEEYLERQQAACDRLAAIGELRHARQWIAVNSPPTEWTGTPMEYAEEEMMISPLKKIRLFFEGLFS